MNKFLKFAIALALITGIGYTADRVGLFEALRLTPQALPTGGIDGELRVDSVDNKLKKFNESTVLWEEIAGGGSTTTGAENVLKDSNHDFEDGATVWAESGGSFTAETTNELFDTTSGNFNSSATAQNLDSALIAVPKGLEGASCLALIWYRYAAGTSGDYTLNALDSSANILSTVDLVVTTDTRQAFVFFTCPTADSVRIRISSTANAGDLILDNAHLGENFKLFETGQAEIIGTLNYDGATNCQWSTTSASMAVFAADSDCNAPTVTGAASAPGTKIPGIDFTALEPGKYKVTMQGTMLATIAASTTTCRYTLSDGTTTSGTALTQEAITDSSRLHTPTIIGVFEYSIAQSSHTFQLQGKREGGDGTCLLQATNSDQDIDVYVERFPSANQTAVKLAESDWFVDVNIGGSTSVSTGATAKTVYSEASATTQDMVINRGVTNVQIPCLATASEGLTCNIAAVAEVLGIVFQPIRAGLHQVCFHFSDFLTANAAGGFIETVWQVIETPNNSATILQEGGSRLSHELSAGATDDMAKASPSTLCGLLDFNDTSQRTVKLMFEQRVGGIVTGSVLTDRLATAGQRDLRITVRPWNQHFANPVILNSVITPDEGGAKVAAGSIINAGTPTIDKNYGSWMASLVDNAVGDTTINFTAGTFTDVPVCAITDTGGAVIVTITLATSSSVRVVTSSADTPFGGVDRTFFISCIGPR